MDLPYGEVPLVVRWHKRQFACRERLCPRTAFTESIAELPPYARITGRTRRAAGASIGSGRSVRAVCGELPMSWPTGRPTTLRPDTALQLLLDRRRDNPFLWAPNRGSRDGRTVVVAAAKCPARTGDRRVG
jgi:hypothetical protein